MSVPRQRPPSPASASRATAGAPAAAFATAGPDGVRRISSAELFAGAREVVIAHEHDCYRLRRTSKGKLILTK